jgi:hypothetical protein
MPPTGRTFASTNQERDLAMNLEQLGGLPECVQNQHAYMFLLP